MTTTAFEKLRSHARLGNLPELMRLCEHKDPRTPDPNGLDALMHAARSNQRDCVLFLMGRCDSKARSRDKLTALMHAAQTGSASCAMALLSTSDPHAVDRNKRTALIIATHNQRAECVRVLAPSSDFSARDANGRTALALACIEGYADIARILIDHAQLPRDKPCIEEAIAFTEITQSAQFLEDLCLHYAIKTESVELGLATARHANRALPAASLRL